MTATIASKQETSQLLQIPVGRIVLSGNLMIPATAKSLVIFSHGSGSSRFSPRNNFVAQQLQKKGIGTFLVDLLTPQEDTIYSNRFDIDLLTDRLVEITRWLAGFRETRGLPVGYFGASTGAASALKAAALLPDLISAVVSRGGRPDLAHDLLGKVEAPTLLIVGELDFDVLRLNQTAYDSLGCEKKLMVVADATHLFEEPGTLEEASLLALAWFKQHLTKKEVVRLD
jgi:pimeloyl-ACP methyl ester carboxylesterase